MFNVSITERDKSELKKFRFEERERLRKEDEAFDIQEVISNLEYIDYIEKGQGFCLDFRAPRWDPVAVAAAKHVIGDERTSHIIRTFKRAHLTKAALYQNILEYNRKNAPRLENDAVYIAAFQSVREQFVPQVKVIPTDFEMVRDHPDVPKDKSPGDPFKSRGYKSKRDVMCDPAAMREIKEKWRSVERSKVRVRLYDTLVFARSQISKISKNKVRATWGYPTTVFMEEARFLYPYLAFLKARKDDFPIAYGVEMMNGGMAYVDRMYTNSRNVENSRAVLLDWNKFDKTIPAWLIRDAFSILAECFDFSKIQSHTGEIRDVDPLRTKKRWNRVVDYFINTPFRMPDGHRFEKHAGVPSGSAWTNIIDSIVNAIVTRYCMFHVTGSFPMYDIYMGDDSVCMVQGHFDMSDFKKIADETFKMDISFDKSYTTTDRSQLSFLGYFNHLGSPIRNVEFLWASFLFPEHVNDIEDPKNTAIRALGQMYSSMNVCAARYFSAVIDYVSDRYPLPKDWVQETLEEHPSRFKFLRMHGFEYGDIQLAPIRDGIHRLELWNSTPKRNPQRRTTSVQDVYYRFYDNPPPDFIECYNLDDVYTEMELHCLEDTVLDP